MPLPPPLVVLTTEEVILQCLTDPCAAFRSVCETYHVDFYSNNFVITSPAGPGVMNAEVFDEEEFSIGFSDTVWEPSVIA